MKPMVVGLTGTMGSGKSTVAAMFQRLGALVINADAVAHQLYKTDSALCQKLGKRFGAAVMAKNGGINVSELARRAFATRASAAALSRITHPAIIKEINRQIAAAGKAGRVCVIDAPLLIEAGIHALCDAVIIVVASSSSIAARAATGGRFTPAQVRRRTSHQLPVSKKMRSCDYLIDNSGSLAATRRQVGAMYAYLTNQRQ